MLKTATETLAVVQRRKDNRKTSRFEAKVTKTEPCFSVNTDISRRFFLLGTVYSLCFIFYTESKITLRVSWTSNI